MLFFVCKPTTEKEQTGRTHPSCQRDERRTHPRTFNGREHNKNMKTGEETKWNHTSSKELRSIHHSNYIYIYKAIEVSAVRWTILSFCSTIAKRSHTHLNTRLRTHSLTHMYTQKMLGWWLFRKSNGITDKRMESKTEKEVWLEKPKTLFPHKHERY